MNPVHSLKVRVDASYLSHGLDQALRGRFVLQADYSIPIGERMTTLGVIDEGSFAVRGGGILGTENRATRGIFILHRIERESRTRDVLGEVNILRRKHRRNIAATTHELIEMAGFSRESIESPMIAAVGRDDFTFIDGEDIPHFSILRWSEAKSAFALSSEPFHSIAWPAGSSVLLWA